MNSPDPHLIGKRAEQQALQLLTGHGLQLVARNWHSRFGEIDLIMQEHATLVFVEVRYRSHSGYAGPIESVTKVKQQKIITTASLFLQQHPGWQQHDCRFDIVGVTGTGHSLTLNWLRHAFDASL